MLKKFNCVALIGILPIVMYACEQTSGDISKIYGELALISDEGETVYCPSFSLGGDLVKTYCVTTFKEYVLTVRPVMKDNKDGVKMDLSSFSFDANAILLENGDVTVYLTDYAELVYQESGDCLTFKATFTRQGSFDIGFNYGNKHSSISFDCDNDSTYYSSYYKKLGDVLSWSKELNSENVTEVCNEDGALGVAPGSLLSVYRSNDSEDIKNALSIFDSDVMRVNTSASQVSGGSYSSYSFKTATETNNVFISNNFIYVDGIPYYYYGNKPAFASPYLSGYKFTVYGTNPSKVYEISYVDGSLIHLEDIDYLSGLEFVAYDGDTSLLTNAKYKIEDYNKLSSSLYVYSNEIFSYMDSFYKLAGEQKFDFYK